MPVFLLDHECTNGTHEMRFRVTNVGLRPGLLLRRRNNSHFFAVTVEGHDLVLASYLRSSRRVLTLARVPPHGLDEHMLRVVVSGRRLAAGLWRVGEAPRMQLHATLPGVSRGAPGVLLGAPLNLEAGSLLVKRYSLTSPALFRRTAAKAAFLITGTPQLVDGSGTVALRAALGRSGHDPV